MLLLRKPTVRDVPRMIELMAPGVRNEALLPRSARAVVERLRDYVVVESRGELVGLASVSLLSAALAEVGAVVWQDAAQLGLLLDAALDEARALGVSRAFVMAPDAAPYEALGFTRQPIASLPEKRDHQCLRCARLPRCRQLALVKELESVVRAQAA